MRGNMNRTLYIVSTNTIKIIWFSCEIHWLIVAVVLLKYTVIKKKPTFF